MAALLVLAFSSCAAGPKKAPERAAYDLPELSALVYLPPDYLVITRNTVHGRETLEARNIDVAACQAAFEQAGIYLNAMPEDFLCEYVITSHTTAESARIGDFAAYTGAELNEIISAENLASQFRLEGIDADAGPTVTLNGSVYYTVDFQHTREDGSRVYSRQFFTIVNGIAVNIFYNKYGQPISAGDAETCGNVVGGIVFSRTENR